MVKEAIILGKRYEVLSKIGAGGMADVYKGKDLMLNRYVAIKVLKKEYKEDENFIRKFRSEAQAAAGLMNPNIVNVYDVGEDRGLYYMIMELVEGITLKEYIQRKGRLSHKEVISIAIQMCTGIGAAHAAGIIHRDIKPHNIIISKEGKVKVTDLVLRKRFRLILSVRMQWDLYIIHLQNRQEVDIVMRKVMFILLVSLCMKW